MWLSLSAGVRKLIVLPPSWPVKILLPLSVRTRNEQYTPHKLSATCAMFPSILIRACEKPTWGSGRDSISKKWKITGLVIVLNGVLTPTYAPPGGENRLEVARRAMDVVRDLHRDLTSWGEDERPVLLVAHGGTFLALAAALIDSPLQNYAAFSALGNTSWSQFTEWPQYFVEADLDAHPAAAGPRIPAIPPIQPGYQWRVDVWNSTTHLGSDAF